MVMFPSYGPIQDNTSYTERRLASRYVESGSSETLHTITNTDAAYTIRGIESIGDLNVSSRTIEAPHCEQVLKSSNRTMHPQEWGLADA